MGRHYHGVGVRAGAPPSGGRYLVRRRSLVGRIVRFGQVNVPEASHFASDSGSR